MLCMVVLAWGQQNVYTTLPKKGKQISLTDTVERLQFHGNVFTGVNSGWGHTRSYMGVAPTLDYRFNDRWTLKTGFMVMNTIDPMAWGQPRSMAPLRNNSVAGSMSVGAEYQASDRLWVSASAFYLGGAVNPLWNPTPAPYQLDVYGMSASMRYRIGDRSFLDLNVNIVHDNTGALGRMMWENPYCYGWGGYGYGLASMPLGSGFGWGY